jgi:hypothetical protein
MGSPSAGLLPNSTPMFLQADPVVGQIALTMAATIGGEGGTMKSRIIILAAMLVFGPIGLANAAGDQPAASPAPAQPAAAPAPAAPMAAGPPSAASEMAQLNVFQGTVHCTGTQSASQFGPEHPTITVVHGRADLNGFWMTMRYNERKTKQNPFPFHALYQIGYDSSAKQFLLIETDNFGGHAIQTASGWDGNKLTLTGDYVFGGGKLSARDTFTKNGDKEIDHLGEIQGSDGKWATLDQETCKR